MIQATFTLMRESDLQSLFHKLEQIIKGKNPKNMFLLTYSVGITEEKLSKIFSNINESYPFLFVTGICKNYSIKGERFLRLSFCQFDTSEVSVFYSDFTKMTEEETCRELGNRIEKTPDPVAVMALAAGGNIKISGTLSEFERKYEGCGLICGIDEVGRGPLAGPVVAGAVILPKDCDILYINDSKKLSEKMRDILYDEIKEKAVACAVGYASSERIDEINILQATYEAMREAISKLSVTPDILLNDAVTIPQVNIRQVPIIKGDAKSISIGAASIFAKVTRDRLMLEYDKQFPEYGFAKHVGYGTAQHIEALKKYGPCPIHRRTFIKNFIG